MAQQIPVKHHHGSTSSLVLNPATIKSYHKHGYYIWQSFMTHRQLQTLRTNVDRVLASLHPNCDPEWIQHIHQLEQGKWMLDFASSIKHIAASLLNDPSPVLYSSQIAVRHPGSPESTPWHQDGPGANVCTFWIALDRIDEHNGGLQVIPGGHHHGRLSLKKLSIEKQNEEELSQAIKMASHNVYEIQPNQLTPATAFAANTFKYRLRAGGAGVHHDSLPHRANRNNTVKPRRVIILRFMNSTNEKKTGKFLHYLTGEYVARNYVDLV